MSFMKNSKENYSNIDASSHKTPTHTHTHNYSVDSTKPKETSMNLCNLNT